MHVVFFSSKDSSCKHLRQMMRCWLLTFEEGFLKDEVVDVEAAGEASVVVGEAHIAGLLQREQLFHLQSMTFFLFLLSLCPCCCISKKNVGECSALCRYEVVGITFTSDIFYALGRQTWHWQNVVNFQKEKPFQQVQGFWGLW